MLYVAQDKVQVSQRILKCYIVQESYKNMHNDGPVIHAFATC